jgi:hypothetical protein
MTSMDCREFEQRLDAFEAGILLPDEQQRANSHLEICVRCRELLDIIRGETDLLAPDACEDLLQSILSKTCGPSCGVAENSLCEWIDGTLVPLDHDLVSLHLTHCPTCAGLAATLLELKEVLPDMAAVEPDQWFTADVLRATIGLRSDPVWQRPGLDWKEFWSRLWRRPRFAWEAAYVGALLVLMALGSPGFFPGADTLPRLLVARGDQLFKQSSTALADQQGMARQSLGTLQQQGKDLLDRAAALQSRTTSHLRDEVTAILGELKNSLPGASPGPK